MYIRKKTFVLIITYLSAAVLALGAYTAAHSGLESGYRRTAEYGYSHAFEEVVLAADNLSQALPRACYATGDACSAAVCADIYANSLSAAMTMAALPFSTQELEQTAAFIGLAGDYAGTLLKQAADGGLDDAARANFAALYKTSAGITEQLRQLRSDLDDGVVTMDAPENPFLQAESLVSDAMLELESGLSATSIDGYDGKYSAVSVREYPEPVSEQAARCAAAEFFGLDPEQLELRYCAQSGERCFSFDGGDICVDGGGNVLSLSSNRPAAGDMSDDELTARAWDFLSRRGFENMHLVSAERLGGVLALEFQCTKNGARCVGDGVKLSIAGDDGEVYSYDAAGHVNNHDGITDQTPAVSELTARSALPDTLTVTSAGQCYARTDGGKSVLCYEFDCLGLDGEGVCILVDARTGRQFAVETMV